MIDNKFDICKIILEDIGSGKPIVIFFDGLFHIPIGRTVKEISEGEAYKLLNEGGLLWSIRILGLPEVDLPADCPNVYGRFLSTSSTPMEFLSIILDHHNEKKLKQIFNDLSTIKN